jgi:hypothetical protein
VQVTEVMAVLTGVKTVRSVVLVALVVARVVLLFG